MTPSSYYMTGSVRDRTQVEVSVERLPGGCLLYSIEWKARKPDAPLALEGPK